MTQCISVNSKDFTNKQPSDSRNIPLFKVFMAPTAAEEVTKTLNSGYIG